MPPQFDKTQDFYNRLTDQLKKDTKWPAPYLYKFIVPSDDHKVEAIKTIFAPLSAKITVKVSSKGNYSSVSVAVVMDSPDSVVQKYREVSKVEGVISL
ncbi:MAG: DUF493 family protein [Flavobacteriaceae bacterium]|jgi:uncharacterized protein|nr:DUF493 family protein [Flavobacteriaceae bacterium]MDG1961481.1 DUF493 family protein [Flavobacteriaceae bacterium]